MDSGWSGSATYVTEKDGSPEYKRTVGTNWAYLIFDNRIEELIVPIITWLHHK